MEQEYLEEGKLSEMYLIQSSKMRRKKISNTEEVVEVWNSLGHSVLTQVN